MMFGNISHLSSIRKASCPLHSQVKGVWLFSKSFLTHFSFHITQSGLWMRLDKMSLEISGCRYDKVWGKRHPAALFLGQNWKYWEQGAGPLVPSVVPRILPQNFSSLSRVPDVASTEHLLWSRLCARLWEDKVMEGCLACATSPLWASISSSVKGSKEWKEGLGGTSGNRWKFEDEGARWPLGSPPMDGHSDSLSLAGLVVPFPGLAPPFLFLPTSHILHCRERQSTWERWLSHSPTSGQAPPLPVQYLLLFSRSVESDSLQLHAPAVCHASLSFIIFQSLFKLIPIELMMPSNHLILCCPLLLPSIFPSIRVFFNKSALRIRWPKYWSVSFSISPSNEYSGLISSRIDWFDLLAVQGTLKVFSSTTIWKHRVFTKDLTYKCH